MLKIFGKKNIIEDWWQPLEDLWLFIKASIFGKCYFSFCNKKFPENKSLEKKSSLPN